MYRNYPGVQKVTARVAVLMDYEVENLQLIAQSKYFVFLEHIAARIIQTNPFTDPNFFLDWKEWRLQCLYKLAQSPKSDSQICNSHGLYKWRTLYFIAHLECCVFL